MKNIALLLLLVITFTSCKSSKQMASIKSITTESNSKKLATNLSIAIEAKTIDLISFDLPTTSEILMAGKTRVNRIVDYAFAFDGVTYKRGGTTIEGMDCSGLVVTSFDSENIALPRTSRDIARTGSPIDIKQVNKGDLLFFATRRNSRTISHVGIVTTAREGFVEFIHASTSNGVMVSNMAEKYWHFAFIQARRVI